MIPTTRRSSSLRRLSSSGVRRELSHQTIVHASIPGRAMGCQVASTISFNNTTASQRRQGPASVRLPPSPTDDESSDSSSSDSSACSCDDCRDALTETMTPSTVIRPAPRTPTRNIITATRATRSAASALPPTSRLLSPPSRRSSSGRPRSVPPAVSRPMSTSSSQGRRSSMCPPLERYMTNGSSPSETNSLRSQQGSVVTRVLPETRRPSSAPIAYPRAPHRDSSPVSPSVILRYGEFHPIRDSAMWKNKKSSPNRESSVKRNSISPRHTPVTVAKINSLASPNFESCQGSTAVGLSSSSSSTAMMAKFPAWQHEQQRHHHAPKPIITESLHAAEWGHIRMSSKKSTKSSKDRHHAKSDPSESSIVDLECGVTLNEETLENLNETSTSMKILGLNNCAVKLRFVLVIVVTFLLLIASLALYYDLRVANQQTV